MCGADQKKKKIIQDAEFYLLLFIIIFLKI